MRLARYEFQKLLERGTLLIIVFVIILANLFLIWVNSSAASDAAPPQAYRALVGDLSGLTMDETKAFVESKYQTVIALLYIEQYLFQYSPPYMREDFRLYYAEYGHLYGNDSFDMYTETLIGEYRFLSAMRSELNTVADYDAFLAGVQDQANLFTQISIFAKEDSFDQRNIDKTAAAYQSMRDIDISIDYYPQKGLVTALNFSYTDLFILAFMLLVAGQLINTERDSGMLFYVRSLPGGRLRTAIAKTTALAVAMLIILIGLYGVNLLFCEMTYGLGSLSRSVQSTPFLMRCTMNISVAQYLFVFLLAKWFVSVVLGMGVMLAILATKRLITGWCLSLGILGIQWYIRTSIDPLGTFNVVKHANFASFLQINEWLGSYRNLYWFGYPLEIFRVVVYSACLFGLLFLLVFLTVFSKAHLSAARILSQTRVALTRPTTVFHEELFKLILTGGAGVLLLCFAVFQVYQASVSVSYITPEEIYYRYYIEPLTGTYTQEKFDWLQEQSIEFEESYEMDKFVATGAISQETYAVFKAENYSLYFRREAFEQILHSDIPYILQNEGAQFVNPAGYRILYDLRNQFTLRDTLFTCLLIPICLSNVFAIEQRSGMGRLLQTTPLGRYRMRRHKLLVSAFVVGIITLLVLLPAYWRVIRDYGLPAFFAPAKSVRDFALLPNWISFFVLSIFTLLYRLAAGVLIGIVTLLLSKRTGRFLTTAFLSCAIFCLPPLLALYGIKGIEHLGVYPMIHFPLFTTQPGGFIYLILLFIFVFILFRFCFTAITQFEKDDWKERTDGSNHLCP